MMKEGLSGPVNLVAPLPVSQAEFAKILAKKVHRPAFCHLPAWALKIALGEMAEETILTSQNVKPEKLLNTGYVFRYSDLQTALDYVM
jgi:NAD dependent epimerase/dehydratase family enzyme